MTPDSGLELFPLALCLHTALIKVGGVTWYLIPSYSPREVKDCGSLCVCGD